MSWLMGRGGRGDGEGSRSGGLVGVGFVAGGWWMAATRRFGWETARSYTVVHPSLIGLERYEGFDVEATQTTTERAGLETVRTKGWTGW